MKLKYYLLGVLSAVVVLFVAVGGYYLGKENSNSTSIAIPTSTLEEKPITKKASMSKSEAEDAAATAVREGNFLKLLNVMAQTVEVRIEGSGCCAPMLATDAIEEMQFLEGAKGKWKFTGNEVIAADLSATLPAYYTGAFIGTTEDGYLVAFLFNKENKIEKISMTSDYTLLTQ
jgi:hypothetical protein